MFYSYTKNGWDDVLVIVEGSCPDSAEDNVRKVSLRRAKTPSGGEGIVITVYEDADGEHAVSDPGRGWSFGWSIND